MEMEKIWIEQCDATHGIREQYGLEKALGYLIGEKLVNFIQESDKDQVWAKQLPLFISEVKRIFSQIELRDYLENIRYTGALAHTANEDEFGLLQNHWVFDSDPVRGAEDMMIVARIKEMLLR